MRRTEIKRRPLSDTALAALEAEAKEYRELDGNGLYFRVKPNGQKSWQLRYKNAEGKWSWLGLGPYPDVTAAEARKKATTLRTQASSELTPILTRRARKAAEDAITQSTFEALAREWFEVRRPSWEAGTAKRNIGAIELHVFPVFGSRPFADILPNEWMALFRTMERKGILEQLKRVRRSCTEIYDLARVTGRAVHNPLEGVSRFLQTRTAESYAHVSLTELPALLRAIRGYQHATDVRLGLRLLAITGVRPTELREAPWTEFDFEKALWTIPASRMKKRREHLVPLSRQAIDLLTELRMLTGSYPLLFPGRQDRKKPRSNMVFNMALRRLGYDGKQTGHGFRHIASTILNENGFDENHIEAQLSHVKDGVAGVYNKAVYLEPRRKMMQWYADYLDKLEKGNVLDFGAARRN